MGMSTSVVGIKPPDAQFKKMLKAYKACEEAGIGIPSNISDYFNNEEPNELGVEVDESDLGEAIKKYGGDGQSGYDVHLDKLPKDVKIIRFFNSW